MGYDILKHTVNVLEKESFEKTGILLNCYSLVRGLLNKLPQEGFLNDFTELSKSKFKRSFMLEIKELKMKIQKNENTLNNNEM